jgi:serine/threonine protein kinase
MIKGGDCDYGTGVDIWSLGIILHAMLCGELPLTLPPTFVSGSSQSNNAWDHVSEMGKRLVTQMLQENPTLRPTAAQALKSEWFNQKNTTSTAGTKERRISMQAQALWSTVRSKLKVASKDKRVGEKKMHV